MNSDREPWTRLISIEEILELYDLAIEKHGGEHSKPKEGCLEGSLGAAWNAELYTESDDSIPGLCFAGSLVYYLILNHCFIDGNKRIAWAAAMEILRAKSLTVGVSDDDAEDYCIGIINGKVERAVDVATWLAPRLEAFPPEL